jgi:hypothetical protein
MTINETVAKKLGEVLAFNRVGEDTIAKGRTALTTALGEEKVMDMEEKFRIHGEGIIQFATEQAAIDTVLAKSAKTEEKLKTMRNLYIGEKWDDAIELLEWSGFFEGAAVVHWAFIRGASEALNDEMLMTFSEEGKNYRYELLEMAESELEAKGQDKAMQ